MNGFRDRITIHPGICHGKPTVRGLRYPVEMILDLLSGGMSIDDLLRDYPDLERADILAVLAYAAHLIPFLQVDCAMRRGKILNAEYAEEKGERTRMRASSASSLSSSAYSRSNHHTFGMHNQLRNSV